MNYAACEHNSTNCSISGKNSSRKVKSTANSSVPTSRISLGNSKSCNVVFVRSRFVSVCTGVVHRPHLVQESQEKRSREHQQYHQSTTSTSNNNVRDDDQRQEFFSEKRFKRFEREARHRSPSESSDISTGHGVIDEEFKKKYLRCLAYMKLIERLYENQQESDDDSENVTRRLSRRVRASSE